MLGSYLTSAYSPRGVGRERILGCRMSKWQSIRTMTMPHFSFPLDGKDDSVI